MLAPESVLAWIIIGGIAGWLAGLLVKGYGFGLIGNTWSASLVPVSPAFLRRGLASIPRPPAATLSPRHSALLFYSSSSDWYAGHRRWIWSSDAVLLYQTPSPTAMLFNVQAMTDAALAVSNERLVITLELTWDSWTDVNGNRLIRLLAPEGELSVTYESGCGDDRVSRRSRRRD